MEFVLAVVLKNRLPIIKKKIAFQNDRIVQNITNWNTSLKKLKFQIDFWKATSYSNNNNKLFLNELMHSWGCPWQTQIPSMDGLLAGINRKLQGQEKCDAGELSHYTKH